VFYSKWRIKGDRKIKDKVRHHRGSDKPMLPRHRRPSKLQTFDGKYCIPWDCGFLLYQI